MNRKTRALFLALILAQVAHSAEEYLGRLYESFPPARALSGLISADLPRGFLIFNAIFDTFGLWCFLCPVRKNWRSARAIMWFWVGVELLNGTGHPLWSIWQGGYTPGVVTALILLVLAILLARQLRSTAERNR